MTTLHSPKRSLRAPRVANTPRCPLLPNDLRACLGSTPTSHRLALFVPALDSAGPTAPLTQPLSLEGLRLFTLMVQPLPACLDCTFTTSAFVRVPFAVHFEHGDARLWLVCSECGTESEGPRRKRGDVSRLLKECCKRAPCRVDTVVDLPDPTEPN